MALQTEFHCVDIMRELGEVNLRTDREEKTRPHRVTVIMIWPRLPGGYLLGNCSSTITSRARLAVVFVSPIKTSKASHSRDFLFSTSVECQILSDSVKLCSLRNIHLISGLPQTLVQ
jgi:hypothetical protein